MGVLVALIVSIVMVQAVCVWTMQETKWTQKAISSGLAFHAAEAGLQQGYRILTQTPSNWDAVAAGGAIAGYDFDAIYPFDAGTEYAVSLTSTSDDNTITVTASGRDPREVRTLRATYVRNYLGNVAVQVTNGVSITGNNFNVEWGAVVSPSAIVADEREHPQFWSAVSIDLDDNGPTPPNCDNDCVQWHSYSDDVGGLPAIDLDFYKSSAQATGTYYSTSQTWSSKNFNTGYTYFIEGDLNVTTPGNFIQGNLIVMGDLNLPSGNWGSGSLTMSVPQNAWKQYGNDWSFYKTNFDASAPASFPGLTSDYESSASLTKTTTKAFLKGFLYVQGDIYATGGGGSADIYGAVMSNGNANIDSNSTITVYYSNAIATNIHTSQVSAAQTSWRELSGAWPAGL